MVGEDEQQQLPTHYLQYLPQPCVGWDEQHGGATLWFNAVTLKDNNEEARRTFRKEWGGGRSTHHQTVSWGDDIITSANLQTDTV
jgi:hypothetical protein